MAKSKEKTHAEKLLDLVKASGARFFRDQYDRPHARIRQDGHWEIRACSSEGFETWLTGLGYRSRSSFVPNRETLGAVLNLLKAKARFEGERHHLYNRVALYEGHIYYDLADERWRAVEVSECGWRIVDSPPILFRRHGHQGQQVEPVRDGDLEGFLRFVPLNDPAQQLLALVHLVSSLIPEIPHPVAVIHGQQGSGKTSLMRRWRGLIDPSLTPTLTLPRRDVELVQQLSHNWAPCYDNISRIEDWISDALCRAVTGEGFTKRSLYTNDEDFIYRFRCCITLNGIDVVVNRPDLLDRSILYELERIPDDQRRTERELETEFEELRPALFGAMLDALAGALALTGDSTELEALPRMADFAQYGACISQALGRDAEEFLDAYAKNRSHQNEEILASSAVGSLICALMEDRQSWEGTATDLLEGLEKLAEPRGFRCNEVPQSPSALMRQLNRLSTNLAAAGIRLDHQRNSRHRRIILTKEDA